MSCRLYGHRKEEWGSALLYWLEADFKQRPIKTERWKNTAEKMYSTKWKSRQFNNRCGNISPRQTGWGIILAELREPFQGHHIVKSQLELEMRRHERRNLLPLVPG